METLPKEEASEACCHSSYKQFMWYGVFFNTPKNSLASII